MKATPENISKLNISVDDDNDYINFNLGEFNFDVKYRYLSLNQFFPIPGPGGDGYSELKMDGEYLKVSSEVCKKIQKEIIRLKNADSNELREYDKKDFLSTYKK